MKKILVVHQSSDLYGSDLMLLYFLENLSKWGMKAIVLLPNEGVLQTELARRGVEVEISNVVKVTNKSRGFGGVINLVLNSIRFYFDKHGEEKYRDVTYVYSSTLAVIGGVILASLLNKKHIWHVHELIDRPLAVRKFYSFLLRKKADMVIYNSNSTKLNYENFPLIGDGRKVYVVKNGTELPDWVKKEEYCSESLGVLLIGRLSERKGQAVLIEAIKHLYDWGILVNATIVGDAVLGNGVDHKEELLRRVVDYKIEHLVTFIPYRVDARELIYSADIVVVPSILPESFGLVVIEAMARKTPVIVSDVGALTEIVSDGETGFVVEAGDSVALARKIQEVLREKERSNQVATNAYNEWKNSYTLDKYVENMRKIFY